MDAQSALTAEQRRILAVVLVPLFMSLLAISSVNVILPSIETSLNAGVSEIQWVLTGYTLAFGVILVASGRAGDVYGRGRLYFAGLALFGLGSLLSGVAPNGVFLDLARIVMGFGSGLLNPQTVGFIQQYFAGPARAKAFGAFGTMVGVSVAAGPLMSGGLIALLGPEWGWRSSFLVNVPIAVLALALGRIWIPASAFQGSDRTGGRPDHPDLDPVGMVMFGASMVLIMLTFLEHARGLWTLALMPAGLALLALWLWWERRYSRRGREPMVDLSLFAIRSYANGSLVIGLYFTGVTSIYVIVAIYLQNGHGASALHASLVGLPGAIMAAISSHLSGRVVLRLGRRLVMWGIGVGFVGASASALVIMGHQWWGVSPWWLFATLAFMGVAQGMVVSPNQTLSLMDVPVHQSGAATGVMQTGQRVGTAMGIAVITAVFFAVQANGTWDEAFGAAFGLVAALIAVSGLVALVDVARSGR